MRRHCSNKRKRANKKDNLRYTFPQGVIVHASLQFLFDTSQVMSMLNRLAKGDLYRKRHKEGRRENMLNIVGVKGRTNLMQNIWSSITNVSTHLFQNANMIVRVQEDISFPHKWSASKLRQHIQKHSHGQIASGKDKPYFSPAFGPAPVETLWVSRQA